MLMVLNTYTFHLSNLDILRFFIFYQWNEKKCHIVFSFILETLNGKQLGIKLNKK